MQLPVVEIAAEAYHFVWRHRRTLAERASVPVALCLLVGIGESLMFDAGAPPADVPTPAPVPGGVEDDAAASGGGPAGAGLLALTYLAASLPFLVSWYRLVIDGTAAIAGRPPISYGRPEGRMLLWMVLIGLVLVVPMVIAGSIAIPFAQGDVPGGQVPLMPLLLAVFFFILLILASLRLSFVFPAIAVEEPASFQRAWELTKGNSLRLLALAAAVHLPPLVFGAILEAMVIGIGTPFSITLLVDLVISFTIMAMGATMFGVAYARLR